MAIEKSRRYKQEWMMAHLKRFWLKNPDKIPSLGKLLAEFAVECCSSVRTGKEILQTFMTLDLIKVDEDYLMQGSKWK